MNKILKIENKECIKIFKKMNKILKIENKEFILSKLYST